MNKPLPGRPLLADLLLEMDEARNARPRTAQQPSEMIKERDARLASQAQKIAALRQQRESAGGPISIAPECISQPSEGEMMASKRELIDTGTDKRYVRRNKRGASFVESDDVGRSLAADRRKRAKTKVQPGQGDKGDRRRAQPKGNAARKKSTRS